MAKIHWSDGRRSYTMAEKVALVTEIDRRHRAGKGSLVEIARQLGTTDTNYHNWRRAGIEPSSRQDGAQRALEAEFRAVEIPAVFSPAPGSPIQVRQAMGPHLTLSTPSGYRVEGLGVESAAALLRALA